MKKIHLIVINARVFKFIYWVMLLFILGYFITSVGNKYIDTMRLMEGEENNLTSRKEATGRVAIVIDDFGFNGAGTKEILALQIPITCAVLPFSEFTKIDSELIHKYGQEIIIHIPMEPQQGDPRWLGRKGITEGLSDDEIEEIVREALDELPCAVGINNHMGSKATENQRIMETIMKVLQEKGLFILDSKTSTHSVVESVAEAYAVPYIGRTLFLDNTKDKTYIKKQLKKLGEIAQKEGYAVAIGHVGPEGGVVTASAIREMIPQLEAMGIEFVFLSQLMEKP